MKGIYELLTFPLTVSSNPIIDYIIISVLGCISFAIAWNFVGDVGIRGKAGSIIHWTVRIIVMFFLCAILSGIFKIIIFIKSISITFWVSIFLLLVVLLFITFFLKSIFFSKKEQEEKKISKNKNIFLSIIKKIVRRFYLYNCNDFCEDDIIKDEKEKYFAYNEIINDLKEKNMIVVNDNVNSINYNGVMYLEKQIKNAMTYKLSALGFSIAFISFIVAILSNYDSNITNFICFILMVSMVVIIFSILPNDKK